MNSQNSVKLKKVLQPLSLERNQSEKIDVERVLLQNPRLLSLLLRISTRLVDILQSSVSQEEPCANNSIIKKMSFTNVSNNLILIC
ncbi:hypothetical protein ES702_05675 [subsurface metagenome]